MVGISEAERIDVTAELYPASEPGQDAVSGAVVAVDSAGPLAEFAEHADCETGRKGRLVVGDWLLVIGDFGNAAAKVPSFNDQSPIANHQ